MLNETSISIYPYVKALKILSGSKDNILLSSSEFAAYIGTSQQNASRILLKLLSEGYISREVKNRKQLVTITEKGKGLLAKEFSDLSLMLNRQESITVSGWVQSGLGEGRYYISRKFYITQFADKLGFIPYLGTLNIKVKPDNELILRKLRSMEGIKIEGFITEDRTFGGVKAFRAIVSGIQCAVIFPERSVYSDVLEIISTEYLRGKLNLKDGDEIAVTVTGPLA
ncbi:MAG: DUF120 domain-containing protein [Thermoplasmataceae archaeon]